jgi:hypothetical protein
LQRQMAANDGERERTMKPYGIHPREDGDVDCAGIRENGRASHFGHLPGPGGDIRASQRSAAKRAARRYLKRRARAEGKKACFDF